MLHSVLSESRSLTFTYEILIGWVLYAVCACACVCVCVRERERERQRFCVLLLLTVRRWECALESVCVCDGEIGGEESKEEV